MKQRGKLAMLLAALMLASVVLAGCGGNGGTGESGGSAATGGNQQNAASGNAGEAQEPGSGDFHDELPDDFVITILANDWMGNPNSGEHSEEIFQMIEDYTGYNIEIMWVPSDSMDDRVSAMFAGGKEGLPMIMSVSSTNSVMVNAMVNGAYWPIEDWVFDSETYPNLSQLDVDACPGLFLNGHLYGIYTIPSGSFGRYGMGYRQDWAERLGLDVPETVQDVYDMLYAFTYDDPDGNGKDDTYGLNLCRYTGPLDIMQTWFGCGNGWVEDENGDLIPVHMTPEYMDALNWFKKLYDDGLITSDWAIRDTANWIDDNNNGVAGMLVDCIDNVRKIWDYCINNNIPSVSDPSQIASVTMVAGIARDEASEPRTQANQPTGGFGITQAAESEAEVQACLEFLDKMSDNEMLMLVQYGLEGIHWELNENNEVVRIHPEDTALHKAYDGLNQITPFMPNGLPTNYVFAQDEPHKKQQEAFDAGSEIAVFNPAAGYLSVSPTYVANGGNLNLILDDARTQYIVGDIDEAGLQEAWDLWLSTGGQDVINEVNEQYHAQ